MRLQMRGHQIDWTEELRRHAGRRLHFSLSRFSPAIGRVTVDLGNAARSPDGLDKTCRITVHLVPGGNVVVEATRKGHYSAVDRAAECAGRAVGRALEPEGAWAAGPAPSKAGGGSKP